MSFSLPIPTHWIEIERGPEGFLVEPPGDMILVILVVQTDEDGNVMTSPAVGEYSKKVKAFIDHEGVALEHYGMVSHYHILHNVKGDPMYLDRDEL